MHIIFSMSAVLLLLLLAGIPKFFAYQIPELKFEKLHDGFRVSIPQDKDVSRVAFNINRNRPFATFEQGDFSEQVRTAENGQFVYEVKRKLEDDDKIFAWISVQYKNLIYRKMVEPIAVQFFQNSGDTGKRTTVNTETNGDEEVRTEIANEGNPNQNTECEPSITKATKYNQKLEPQCRGDILFEDNFNGEVLNRELWAPEVRLVSDICEDEFVLYDTSNIFVRDSKLELKATPWNDNKPGTEVRRGLLELGERCTELSQEYCRRQAKGTLIMPPVVSARINTKASFSFQYGRVVVRAKFPAGDWLYPLLYLEPKFLLFNDPQPCFHARIAFSRGNQYLTNTANTEDIGSHRLSGGVIFEAKATVRDQFTVNKTSWDSFSNVFHIYEMIWNKENLIFKVDDAEYGRIRISDMHSSSLTQTQQNLRVNGGPFNRQFALTLGLAAGGHADFPDRGYRKPWVNTSPKATLLFWEQRENWLSSWSNPSLVIDYVRVYAV